MNILLKFAGIALVIVASGISVKIVTSNEVNFKIERENLKADFSTK